MRLILFLTVLLATTVPVFAEGYLDVDTLGKKLAALSAANEQVALSDIGRSREGVAIHSVRIALPGAIPAEERPRLLIVAGLSADHRIGTAVAARLGRLLLDRAAEDPDLAGALARYAVEIIPLVNPDGLALLTGGPRRTQRLNSRPVDEDRDGRSGEDPADDLNGDGVISSMRVRDPAGTFRTSSEDDRLMVPADRAEGERGVWRLLTEGLDRDGDGKINEDGAGGVDLDRNFPHGWQPDLPASGLSSPSESESRALIEHVLRSPRIACILVFGHEDNLAGIPAANQSKGPVPPTGPPPEDLVWWRDISQCFKEVTGASEKAGRQASGAFHQWAYYQAGIPAFSTPVWYLTDEGEPFELPDGRAPNTPAGRLLAFADREDSGFRKWQPYQHPTLGEVEIGGFDPLFNVNPPVRLIEALTDQQASFVKELLARLPRPALTAVTSRATGRGVYEIKLTVVNEGALPAVTAMGRTTRAPDPLRLEIDVPTERLLQGRRRENIDRLDGSGGSATFRWLIRGPPDDVVVIRLISKRCGDAVVEVRR